MGNFNLWELSHIQVSTYYDRPVLYTAKNKGIYYLCLLWNEDIIEGKREDTFLVVPMSQLRLFDVHDNNISLRDAILKPEKGILYLVTGDKVIECTPSELNDNDLPDADQFFI